MLKARLGLNDMRHRWRQSGGSSIDLDHVCSDPSHHRQRVGAVGRRDRYLAAIRHRVKLRLPAVEQEAHFLVIGRMERERTRTSSLNVISVSSIDVQDPVL
jgi:hypothetical protein